MKLTLEHLAPYLPYGLKCISDNGEIIKIVGAHDWLVFGDSEDAERELYYDEYKLVLRSLSDLTQEITHNGETFVPISKFITHGFHHSSWYDGTISIKHLYYHDIMLMFEWHFDVFGLIEKGLAIDINTLKQTI